MENLTKQTKEIYRGKAVIMDVSLLAAEDWKEWERSKLSQEDLSNAFKIVYDVAEGDAHGNRHDVSVEVSRRELSGKMLDWFKREDGKTPNQTDVAIRSLVQQGILHRGATDADLLEAVDDGLIGRDVFIRVYDESYQKKDGTIGSATRCVFVSKSARLKGDARTDRVRAFIEGRAAQKREDAPAPNQNAIPAPTDDDDMPF